MTLNEKPTVTIVDTFELIAKAVLFICCTVAVIWVTTLFCDHKPYDERIIQLRAENLALQDSIYQRTLLTWDNVEFWLNYFQVKEIQIVKKQIKLETNNLTSGLCIDNNNLFAFKMAEHRETTAIGSNRGYAFYPSFIASIKDYAQFQKKYYKGGDYYEFLIRSNYASDTLYVSKLRGMN